MIEPRTQQKEQAELLHDLLGKMRLIGTNGKLNMPTGIGKSMIVTLAANKMVDEGVNVVYASGMTALVEQMREFQPKFRTVTFREFNDIDQTEDPVDVVLYDDVRPMDFGNGILAIRL